jgi:hypothetical protein
MMRIYITNYLVNSVDIQHLYALERSIFGITLGNITLTPIELPGVKPQYATGLSCRFFFINWVPVPLAFAFYLVFQKQRGISVLFLSIPYGKPHRILHFTTFHPAAPPWYVAEYGFQLHQNAPGSSAGFGSV